MRRHGSLRHEQRVRRRRWFVRLFILAVFVGAGWLIYDAGKKSAQSELARLKSEIQRLTGKVGGLDESNAELAAALETKRLESREWRHRYQEEVPTGESRNLLLQVKEQLRAGASVDRLAFLIRSASVDATCDPEPATRRFYVRTPIYEGPNNSVSFEDNAVTVTASGEPANDPQGRPYGWFDPAKPVNVRLTGLGGKSETLKGMLPLHYSYALGRDEVRFSFTKSESKGFVQATATRCRIAKTDLSN